jgi:hypothetical protein
MLFFPGDNVKYVGRKFHSELSTRRGEVVALVKNEPMAIVVDFGDDTYICRTDSLARFVPSQKEEKEIEIVRKHRFDLEEE